MAEFNGEDSPAVFKHVLDYSKELMPNSIRAEIPKASQVAQRDNPDAYQSAVMEFHQGYAERAPKVKAGGPAGGRADGPSRCN